MQKYIDMFRNMKPGIFIYIVSISFFKKKISLHVVYTKVEEFSKKIPNEFSMKGGIE